MLRFVAVLLLQALAFSTYAHACQGGKLSGFYAGLTAGVGKGDVDVSDGTYSVASYDVPYEGFIVDNKGGVFGGYVGFNRQCDRLVFGIEGDYMRSRIDGDATRSVTTSYLDDYEQIAFSTSTEGVETTVEYLASIRGRIGMTVGEDSMIYGTAGLGFTEVDVRVYNSSGDFSLTEKDKGLVVGGGYEGLLTDQLSLRAEVLHYRFSTDRGDFNPTVFRVGGAFHFK